MHLDIKFQLNCFSKLSWNISFMKELFYGCSFVEKLSWKNKFFFEKIFVFFTKYILFAEKMFLYGKKCFILKIFFTEKNFFYREKYKWKCKNTYISFEKYIFMQKMFVLQIKYKSFLNIYSFCKKNFFDHKKYIC